jgi:homogentisate 1,2-dioxygenase
MARIMRPSIMPRNWRTEAGEADRNTMAFMFETRFPQRVTRFAAETPSLQDNYMDCWTGLEKKFNPNVK